MNFQISLKDIDFEKVIKKFTSRKFVSQFQQILFTSDLLHLLLVKLLRLLKLCMSEK